MCFAGNNQVRNLKKKKRPLGSNPSQTTLFVENKYFRPLARRRRADISQNDKLWGMLLWKGDSQILLRKMMLLPQYRVFFWIFYKGTNHKSLFWSSNPIGLLFLSLFLDLFQSLLLAFSVFFRECYQRWPDFLWTRKTAQVKWTWARPFKTETSAYLRFFSFS